MHAARDSQLRGRHRLALLASRWRATAEDMAEAAGRFHRLADPASAPPVFSSFNLFPTPRALAVRAVELAGIEPGQVVLEPSAGTGHLVEPLLAAGAQVVAVEVDPGMAAWLGQRFAGSAVHCADFLAWEPGRQFERVVMNPPFKRGADLLHIERAAAMLALGGRLVAFCADGPRQRAALGPRASAWHSLPLGAFAEVGTRVAAAIVVIDNRR